MIHLHCPVCGTCYDRSEAASGSTIRCVRCRRWIVVPLCDGPAIVSEKPRKPGRESMSSPAGGVLAGLAFTVVLGCWFLVAFRNQKYAGYKPVHREWFDSLTFSQRLGFVESPVSMPDLDKFMMLNQGLAMGTAIASVLTALAVFGIVVEGRRPGLAVLLALSAIPLPFAALLF